MQIYLKLCIAIYTTTDVTLLLGALSSPLAQNFCAVLRTSVAHIAWG